MSAAGDVNGDGFADLIVGATGATAGGTKRGAAYVIFGGNNLAGSTTPLNALNAGRGFTLNGFENSAQVGFSVSGAGDVNGDGFADLLVGAPNTHVGGTNRGEAYVVFAPLPATYAVGTGPGLQARINVYDAKSGLIRTTLSPYGTFTGGVHVAEGDVNGDGAADIIVAPGPGGGPEIKVFDGRTYALLADFNAFAANFTGGVNVAVGDINGDGFADIIAGAGPGGGPDVRIFSGGNVATVLGDFFPYAANFTGGVFVAAGDLNGDGKADVVTGPGAGGGPNVKAFSGASLSTVMLNFFAYAANFSGGVTVAVGDVLGNGHADIITGAGAGGGPHVKVFSNAGALLQSFLAYAPGFSGGVTVAVSDANGDGKADITTGAGAGGGPHVKAFRGTDVSPLRSFLAFDPGFVGGVFVGGSA